MIGTKPVYDAVMRCELLLILGTDYPYPEFLSAEGNHHPGRRQGAGPGSPGPDGARHCGLGAADP